MYAQLADELGVALVTTDAGLATATANGELYRELLVGPYRLMFSIRGNDVIILTAVDGRRDLAELLIERALRGGP